MYLAADIGRGINDAFKQINEATKGISSGTFTVTKDNVLAAAKIIDDHADNLNDLVGSIRQDLWIDPPGEDDVSVRMAAAWNDLLVGNDDSYARRIREYVAGLRKLAVQLGDTARAYGFTEGDISAAFNNGEK